MLIVYVIVELLGPFLSDININPRRHRGGGGDGVGVENPSGFPRINRE